MPDDLPIEIVKAQQLELVKADNQRVARFLDGLDAARKEMMDIIASTGSGEFERARIPGVLQQLEAIRDSISRDLSAQAGSIDTMGTLAKKHSEQAYSILAPSTPAITLQFSYLDRDLLLRFANAARGNIFFKAQSQIDAIQSALLSKIGVRGLSPSAVARELAGKNSMFTGFYPQVETILRTETNTVYNAHTAAGITEANRDYSLGFNKRIHETLDSVRNHPISPVIKDMVQADGRNFAVRVSAVEASANRLGRKSTSGIFWIRKGAFYVGANLPAHYNERGTVTPTKRPPNVDPGASKVT